ncbi:DUF397 domain-containing protein [Nonomuraea sp. MCN248]|uniref:DUF397 domain-containing protein n=1 Tax=Nonomuraea corallina TaxID=2989783 RepID=A0ABT4SB49_9ACTN|nr:DUF397 domain-containing protein [Nonomuraea corallina]MDA0634404.1 DUF397 domain-containing protein [Nonomuraea corallina]
MGELNLEAAEWRKAAASADVGQCVEVATNLPGVVAVRDSKNPHGPALIFTPGEWRAFVGGVRDGEFDLA